MTTLYHNPRCSKSRSALEYLQSLGIDFDTVRYLDDRPNKKQLKEIVTLLGIKPEHVVRKKEKLYKELGLDQRELSDAQWIEVLAEHPKLLERPIVVHGSKAAIGRPLDKIVDLFES